MFKPLTIALAAACVIGAGTASNAQGVASGVIEFSPTDPSPVREVYFPGTETLGPDEMRVIACGTGMPQPRLK